MSFLSKDQGTAVIDLLWDSLKKDPEHKDRRQTGWGTKTKIGLIACVARIAAGESLPPGGDDVPE